MHIRILSATIAAAFVLASCGRMDEPQPSPAEDTGELTVSFRCEDLVSTRSSVFSSTATAIEDVNCYIWDRGVCVAHYFLEGEVLSIRRTVSTGGEYTIYALANLGRSVEPDASGWERDESTMQGITVGRGEKDWTAFPMAGTAGPVSFRTGRQTVTVTLRRLVARLGFCFSPDLMLKGQDITVTAVRLRNAAADVHPFAAESAATSVLSVDDTASASDLQMISEDGTAYFYAFENCRGTLLPGNDDPWQKVPDSIGAQADLCTYLEVDCTLSGEGVIGGEVTYRFYPGDDNVTNFDVRRNRSYIICLCATGDGLDRLSWKVEADIDYMGNQLLTLRKDRGLHPIDDTYLGEMCSCSLTGIDASVLAYFGGSCESLLQNAVVRCIAADGGDDLIEFTGGKVTRDYITGIEGTALRAGKGSVWLCTRGGDLAVPLLQSVTVSQPSLVLSYDANASYPEWIDEPPVALINASPKAIHLYLCDSEGLSLMADEPDQYFFSDRPYRFDSSIDLGDYELCLSDNVEVLLERHYLFDGTQDDVVGQPFATYEYSVTLSDDMDTWDDYAIGVLVDACFATSPPFRITIADPNQELSVSGTTAVSYQRVELCFQNSSGELDIINPSHIPLYLQAYEFTIGDRTLEEDLLPSFGTAYSIPSSVSSALTSSTITMYSAVGYLQPRIYTSPVRSVYLNPLSADMEVERDRWVVRRDALAFKGYSLMTNINNYYSTAAEPGSATGISVDLQAEGVLDVYRMNNIGVSSEQQYPQAYEGGFSGTAIFSSGRYVSSDISGCAGQTDVCTAFNGIIYSPGTMRTLLASNATLSTSSSFTSTSSGKNTERLTVTLKNGKPTDFTFTLNLYGEVTVYPKGTAWSSNTHLIGPDDAVYAKIHSGSTVSSSYYRSVSALRSVHSLSLTGSGTTTGNVLSLRTQITDNLFAQTETDAYTLLNGSNDFQHQYHPIDFYMKISAKTQNMGDIYKGTFSNRGYTGNSTAAQKTGSFFLDTYYYWNSSYRHNKNDDSATTWTFGCHYLETDGIGYVCLVK
ncbi:MAG: hypothetical protein ACI4UJ_05545 [Candidatus Cryptobacteroides sp.]